MIESRSNLHIRRDTLLRWHIWDLGAKPMTVESLELVQSGFGSD